MTVDVLTKLRTPPDLRAWMALNAPRQPWDAFVKNTFAPQPGEHISIIGATGQGKTVLQNTILPHYPFVALMATKPADIELENLIKRGYLRLADWKPLDPVDNPRRVIWPDASQLDSLELQKRVFGKALERAFREGGRPKKKPVGWAIAIDELWYFTNMLGMAQEIRLLLLQGRSVGVSLIGATQRPVHVPLEVYSQPTHLFFFRDNDGRNLARLSEIVHSQRQYISAVVSRLEEHQALYVNTRTGQMVRTRTPPPKDV